MFNDINQNQLILNEIESNNQTTIQSRSDVTIPSMLTINNGPIFSLKNTDQLSANDSSIFSLTDTQHTSESQNTLQNITASKSNKSANINQDQAETQCYYCHKNFSSKWNLKRHMEIHTGNNQQLQCHFCNKVLSLSLIHI